MRHTIPNPSLEDKEDGGVSSFSLQGRNHYIGNTSYICLHLPHYYLSMRIALFFRKNQKKVSGKEPCLFLLPLLGEACRQTEHVTCL